MHWTSSQIFKPCHFPSFMAPLYPPIICRAKACTTRFLYVSCRSPTRTPTLFTCGFLPTAQTLLLPNDPVTATLRPPLHRAPPRSRLLSHPLSRPCSAQADSDHWWTSPPLHHPSSLYGNGLGDGSQLGSGRLGPKDVLVTPQWR